MDKYPIKIGDKFAWVDLDGDIHINTCVDIENQDSDQIETMYFIHRSENGGGTFVTEDDIISMDSPTVKQFLKETNIKEANKFFTENRKDILVDMIYNHLLDGDSYDKQTIKEYLNELINSGDF